ncbi:peptidase S10 [Telmatobacter sp. DSM 110680]|uniref:Peptidase S10 n=1 Tax=Telmatobacter sp. DSM 110680 TaxID=3036704 RepID=A0AAU7DIQ2_9BACT
MIAVCRLACIRVAAAALLCLLCLPSIAQERPAAQQQQQRPERAEHSGGDDQKDAAPKETPVPPEKSSVTHHELALGGKSLKYTATAGTLLIRDEEDKPYGSMFYTAYTLDGAEATARPVSFLYNGGPGAATLWLHMGSFSPVRIQTDSPNATAGPPFKLVPNQYSLLDKTDLVFIDAPLTGYSRAVGKGQAKDFTGVDQDLKAFDRFIARYISVNQRWNSPKFLIGESYGTTRSAGLSDLLGSDGIQLNGIVLISSILNYAIRSPGYDTIYVSNLPSYAAAAWYFNKVQNKPPDVATWVQQAREFAAGPYANALFAGHNLSADKLDSVAKEMSRLTGLSVDYIKEANLRVSPTRFRKEVMRSDRKTLGRYDMRFEGEDIDAAGENPSFDASDTGITGAFVAAIHDYLERELKYETTDTYRPSAGNIGQWDWKHRPAGGGGPNAGGGEQLQPWVAGDLGAAIRKNPHLKVFSANGYFDLATPFFATEYDLDHMNLEPELRGNVQFGYYPSGHMIYLNVDALHQLKDDLAAFIDKASK